MMSLCMIEANRLVPVDPVRKRLAVHRLTYALSHDGVFVSVVSCILVAIRLPGDEPIQGVP